MGRLSLLPYELKIIDSRLYSLHLGHSQSCASLVARILQEDLCAAIVEIFCKKIAKINLLELSRKFVLPFRRECRRRLNQAECGRVPLSDAAPGHAHPAVEASLANLTIMTGNIGRAAHQRLGELAVLALELLVDYSLRSLTYEKCHENRINQRMKMHHLDRFIQHEERGVRRYLVLLADVHLLGVVAGQGPANHWEVEVVEKGVAALALGRFVFYFHNFLRIFQNILDILDIIEDLVKLWRLLEILIGRVHFGVLVLFNR